MARKDTLPVYSRPWLRSLAGVMKRAILSNGPSLAASIVYVGVIIALFEISFLVNDDITILKEIQGGFRTTYMSPLLGYGLSFLYRVVSPGIPWYGLTLCGMIVLGVFMAIRTTVRIVPDRKIAVLLVGIILVFLSPLVMGMSYNGASILLGGAALYVFVEGSRGSAAGWRSFCLPGASLAMSFCIRPHGLLGVVIFSLPVIAVVLLKKRVGLKGMAVAFAPVALCVALNAVVAACFDTEGYRKYAEFERFRAPFHCFPIAEMNIGNRKLLEANGWSDNDYLMLMRWIYWDEEKFNVDTMANVFRYSVPLPGKLDVILDPLVMTAKIKDFCGPYRFDISLLFLLAIASFLGNKPVRTAMSVFYFAYVVAGAFYMHLFYRFPYHVGGGLFVVSIFMMICLASSEVEDAAARGKRLLRVCVVCLACLVGFLGYKTARHRVRTLSRIITCGIENRQADVSFLKKRYPGHAFIVEPGYIVHGPFLNPFSYCKTDLDIVTGGAYSFSPRFYRDIETVLGVKKGREVFPVLLRNKKVHLICTDSLLPIVERYLRETTGGRFITRRLDVLSSGVSVFGFTETR